MITALIGFALLVLQAAAGDVDLASDDGFECRLAPQVGQFGLATGDFRRRIFGRLRTVAQRSQTRFGFGRLRDVLSLDLFDVVIELLDAEHVAVIGYGYARLSVPHGLVHQFLNTGLTVENRVLRMHVQMHEIG